MILVMLPLSTGLICLIGLSCAVLYATFPKLTASSNILSSLPHNTTSSDVSGIVTS